MSKSGRTVLILLLVAFVLLLIVGIVVAGMTLLGRERVAAQTILEADLEQELPEHVPYDAIASALFDGKTTLRDMVEALDRAADDDRVLALVARVGAAPMGMATRQELRDAVLRFRASGKRAIAWSETFGEFGPGNGAYYLASAFDEIHLQPSGDVNLTGLLYESMFMRGTFDKLGMNPRFDQRHEYKNAMNAFTETAYTPAHEEAMQKLLDSRFDQMVRGIGEARGLHEDEVRRLIDGAPYFGAEALDNGLVDGLSYRDEVYSSLEEEFGEDAEFKSPGKYLSSAGRPHVDGTQVALIYGVGAVTRGDSDYNPLTGGATMGSDTVAAALRDAIDDEDIEAILFRVNSPGGSYVASDTIWRETVRAREAGKPIIVSMGDVAGSGGYFVAMSADAIVAQPSTITGSIGVLAGKFVTTEFWQKLGITFDAVQSSDNATLYSPRTDYTPEEWERFQAALDRIYEDFTEKVADGRELPLEKVQEVAKGRIWTGEDALELGLVDHLGGYDVALGVVREELSLEEGAELHLRVFPKPKSPWEMFRDKGRNTLARALLVDLQTVLGPLVQVAKHLGIIEPAGVLTVPMADVAP